MSTVQGPGFSGQHEEVPFGSRAIDRVPGFSSEFIDNVFDPPSPEVTEDPARCSKALETGDCVSKGTGKVPRINGSKSSVASSPSLQGTPGNGKCSFAREPNPTRPDTKVQCAGTTNQRSKRGFDLVDLSRQHSNRIPHVPSYSTVDDRIRCIQHRLGSSSRGPDHRGSVVEGGSNTPYQLPGTPSSLSSSTVFCERAAPNNHSVEVGQYNCNDLHQQNGGNTVTASVSIGPLLMGVVSAEGDILSSSASARERECSGRSGVQNSEGSLRLDAEPQCIQANSSTNGSLRGGFVCISPNQTTTTVLQLEAGSRSRGSGCIQSGLVSSKGFCQPSVVPDSSLPGSVKEAESQDSANHSSVEHPTLVSSSAGAIRRLSQTATPAGRSCEMPNSTRVYNESKGSRPNCMAHLRESFASRGLSSEAARLLLSSWRPKTKSNYNSLFARWAHWCEQRDRDPTSGPLEDVINFLAELFREGYQYRSLNSYRSAISAVHARIDGHTVGQHPLVVRMLKGAFNERPPVARYSAFWDVGVVLRYLKSLGNNESLSLRSLTLKTAMLLA